ncbi:RDD family protein [Pedobacter petrophilus]|uniref:RDD family protein n=1 Tax=Pedobacter petrophilus TaxID=1908241 RepID=A0A7K0G1H9_9SPHI|nr:RDD family protein [Pedobacter petrophilus]MRX77703.1 RDD family protein [Pedobacter petrophilus]
MDFNTNYEELDLEYCRATSGLRLTNYIIDMIFFYLIMFGLGIVLGILAPSLLNIFDGLMGRLISLLLYGISMAVIEGVSNGKSIGKLITGTKAINSDGTDMNFGQAFTRNIIRAIPFNAFSAFGTPCNPWHDRLSNTIVIEEKKATLLKQKETFFDALKENQKT